MTAYWRWTATAVIANLSRRSASLRPRCIIHRRADHNEASSTELGSLDVSVAGVIDAVVLYDGESSHPECSVDHTRFFSK